MLSIVATISIAICGTIVFCADESILALAFSFVVLLCSWILAGNGCYLTDISKLHRQKTMCIISMGLVCMQLCIATFRVRKYLDHGERFALVTSIIYLIAQLTLIYTLHRTKSTLKKVKDEKITPKSIVSRHQSTVVWV